MCHPVIDRSDSCTKSPTPYGGGIAHLPICHQSNRPTTEQIRVRISPWKKSTTGMSFCLLFTIWIGMFRRHWLQKLSCFPAFSDLPYPIRRGITDLAIVLLIPKSSRRCLGPTTVALGPSLTRCHYNNQHSNTSTSERGKIPKPIYRLTTTSFSCPRERTLGEGSSATRIYGQFCGPCY